MLRAQDPGAQQDAEAAREKILKASDQIDMIQSNSETTRIALENMKADIAKLQSENTTLKQQLSDMQAAFDKAEAKHVAERQIVLDEVGKMVAAGKGSDVSKKKKNNPIATTTTGDSPVTKTPDGETAAVGTADAPNAPATAKSGATDTNSTAPKTQKGYYHIVENGETLTLICTAYRQQGVNVTITEIQKANGLTDKSVLKVGQKLFIPKPET